MRKNFSKNHRGHWIPLVLVASFLLWGNVAMAALSIQEAKFSMRQNSISLNQVFHEIEKQTGYSFLVRNNDININEKVSIDVRNKSVEEVLEILFAGKNIRYKVEGERISVYKPQQARQSTITGLVLDAAKEPIIGASVVVIGSTNGCITDFDGKFSLEVSELPVKLQISYIGYKSQEVTVNDTKTIQVVMREDTETLDEVVVVGYGSQKKANLTGAVASVKMDEVIGNRPLSQAADALQGTVPGLFVSSDGNAPGKSKSFQIRGAYSVGIKNDGTVNGYSITSISETPGLGMKAEEADFYKQFENKKVDKFDVVKTTPSKDDEIEAITGSTITSKAMANGCNAAITYFQNKLQGGAN